MQNSSRSLKEAFDSWLFVCRWLLVYKVIKKNLYMLAWRYQFYVLVVRTIISHEWAQQTSEMLLPLEHKIRIFLPCNILYKW